MNKTLFVRWALADHAFLQAYLLAEMLEGMRDLDEGHPCFGAIMTGIATCYFRPFMSAGGLGPLPDEFKKLESFEGLPNGEALRRIHKMLWETRVKLGGHTDLSYQEQLTKRLGGGPHDPTTVHVSDNPPGGLHVKCDLMHMERRCLPAIMQVCKVQMRRSHERIIKFREEIVAERGKVGEFTVTTD